MTASTLPSRSMRGLDRRRRRFCDSLASLPFQFLSLYLFVMFFYLNILSSYVAPGWHGAYHDLEDHLLFRQGQLISSSDNPGSVYLNVSESIVQQQRALCRMRAESSRTIIVHMHIPKSGGTAFALALKSECSCRQIPRPQKGYCKECPHVLPNSELPVTELTQNLWTMENRSFSPPYTTNCRTYNASSRWFGFQKRNRTYTFYSQNRLTSGWPCGVHVGYARLRMCCHRLNLPGIKHVMVTLFREPLARFVSEFYQVAYNRRVISSWDWCLNRIPPLSLTEFFGASVSYPFQSRMTKLLSGSPIQTGAAGEDWTLPGVRESALERALGVVRSTEDFMFGLAEELDSTLELFQFVFRRSFTAPSSCHSHQNSSGCAQVQLGIHDLHGKPLELTTEQKSSFHENNREDKLVYDLASRIFNERIEAMRSLKSLGSEFSIDRKCATLLEQES